MTADELRKVMPYTAGRADAFATPLTAAMSEFGIATARRRAAFLAQVAEESGELRYMRELASGLAYDPPSERATELGNIATGDGPLFKGGGLLMLTGRANYTKCGEALGINLIGQPTLIETPPVACRAAAWFWKTRDLNTLADADRFGEITRLINGGYNGLDARLRYWLDARKAEAL